MLYIIGWIKKRLEKPRRYSDIIGFASVPIVVALFGFVLFHNSSSDIVCPFLNHVTDNAPDADYYSQITAFIGVLFGVGVPVGFQVITSFGERYNNAYLSKLVFDAIKTDLIFYVSYTIMAIIEGILFSYLKVSSQLAFFVTVASGVFSFYYAVNIIKIMFSAIADSEKFANNLITEKSDELLNLKESNNQYNQFSFNEYVDLISAMNDIVIYTLSGENRIKSEYEFERYLKYFADYLVGYEKRRNDLYEFKFNQTDQEKEDSKILRIRILAIKNIMLKIDDKQLLSESEMVGSFYGCFVKDIRNEKEMDRFIYTMKYVYSEYLHYFTDEVKKEKYFNILGWATLYYYRFDDDAAQISEKTKKALFAFISFNTNILFSDKTCVEDIKRFTNQILSRGSGYINNNCIYDIITDEKDEEQEKIIEDIDAIFNSNTFALDIAEYNKLKEKVDRISSAQQDDEIKRKIDKYLDSAYEYHKRYLIGCLLFNVIAKCISKHKNEYVKEILKSHKEYKKKGYKRLLPSNSTEARMMSTTCVELDSEYVFRKNEYDYEAVEKLFSDTDAEHQMF